MLDDVQSLLRNPLIKQGLRVVAPEVAIGLDVLTSVFGTRRRPPAAKALMTLMDKRLAVLLKELAETESDVRRSELEIRVHEILGLMIDWDEQA